MPLDPGAAATGGVLRRRGYRDGRGRSRGREETTPLGTLLLAARWVKRNFADPGRSGSWFARGDSSPVPFQFPSRTETAPGAFSADSPLALRLGISDRLGKDDLLARA